MLQHNTVPPLDRCTPEKLCTASLQLLVLTLVILATALLWEHFGPTYTIELSPSRVSHYQGRTYATKINFFPTNFTHATRNNETRLTLLENGVPLAHPGATFRSIDAIGAGRYAVSRHWLLFAASDDSDPRTNGRRYEARLMPGVPMVALNLLGIAALLTGGIWLTSRAPRFRLSQTQATSLAVGAIASTALLWALLVWSPAPQIISTGDGGNVASIVAAEIQPDRFAGDVVFGNPGNYQFYQTILIPLTIAANYLTNDIGQAYMGFSGPLVFIQMLGFFLLGRRLFKGGVLIPLLLAFATVPPIYVLSGELWGMLGSPLTRSLYAAVLPYIMLVALGPFSRLRAVLLMGVCGTLVYIHPVSAPAGAFGILAMLLAAKPSQETWLRHSVFIGMCGVIFLVAAMPFALTFANVFPSGEAMNSDAAIVAQKALRTALGLQYYDAFHALTQLQEHFWLGLVGAAFAIYVLRREQDLRLILAFAAGVFAASFGVSFLDQTIANLRDSEPLQIDLIRNIRFLVPVALILILWAFAKLIARSALLAVPAVALTAAIWLFYPTPIGTSASAHLLTRHHSPVDWQASARKALRHLAGLPAGAAVLPIPHDESSEGVGLATLAVRYSAFQQIVFQPKDINFLAYSGSSNVTIWNETKQRLNEAFLAATSTEVAAKLREIVKDRGVTHILLYTDAQLKAQEAVLSLGETLADEGEFILIAVRQD